MKLFKNRTWLARFWSIRTGFLISAVLTWPVLAELELFEAFYEFSRVHEDWDIDEIALLIVNLTIALILSVLVQSRQLRSLLVVREAEREEAERNAGRDPLTGLLNRRAFSSVLELTQSQLDGSATQYLAMIDLDRFKPINDLQGHAVGDFVLEEVARRIEYELTSADTIARLGGDEFAIIFGPGTWKSQVEKAAWRLLRAVQAPFVFEGKELLISGSIGLMAWTKEQTSSEALHRADKALYEAKSQGRARFTWYDAELDRQSMRRAQIEAELKQAIKQGEIEPWFQPIVEIETRKITGFEVLARWKHATLGMIPPSVFVEIAEDSGMIGPLGFCLLRQACLSAGQWDKGLNISFNISATQFHDPGLVKSIQEIIEETAFDPRRLTIEVTETSVIRDFDLASQKLVALRDLGMSVALDDFGTGFSSLASLRKLPFDRIKIDREFVTGICEQPQNQKIVLVIMALANGLDLDVTAEGIESLEDYGYLKQLDCSLGQGFLFERAVPAEHVTWLLQTKWSGLQITLPQPGETSETPSSRTG